MQRLCAICFLYFRIKLLQPLDILECKMPQNALTRLDAFTIFVHSLLQGPDVP